MNENKYFFCSFLFQEKKKMHNSFIETTQITSYWEFLRMVRMNFIAKDKRKSI